MQGAEDMEQSTPVVHVLHASARPLDAAHQLQSDHITSGFGVMLCTDVIKQAGRTHPTPAISVM
jgi:hypothetical protein